MKCTQCGQSDQGLTTFVNITSMQTDYICHRCLAKERAGGINTLKKIDKEIADYEELEKMYEDLIKRRPEPSDVPKGLEGLCMTPMSAYKGIQAFLAELKSRRMEILTKADGELRLKYELKKSIEKEEFEKSAEIRDRLQGKKPKKKKEK